MKYTKEVGLTTTVPVEILFAAGHTPVDVNNLFMTAEMPVQRIQEAEKTGYPRTSCSWIKGLYGSILQHKIGTVIGVMVGDCSYTHSLMETLKAKGVQAIPFAYPYDRDAKALFYEMDKLINALGTSWESVYQVQRALEPIRRKIAELDRLTWQEGKVTGWENHLWQVSCSDFNGNYQQFDEQLTDFLREAVQRQPFHQRLRLGYIGVPPILTNMYEYLQERGAFVVYNEVQRQFAMPYFIDDLVEQYTAYTYPYDVHFRLQDIRKEIEQRHLDGVIHYTQSFCHRQIDDIVFRKELDIPILTLEADQPGDLDARTKLRMDAFIDMLLQKKHVGSAQGEGIAVVQPIASSKEIERQNESVQQSQNTGVKNIVKHSVKQPRVCGIDLGSRAVKMAIIEGNEIVDLRTFNTIDFYRDFGIKVEDVFQVDFSKMGVEDVASITSTGYGRNTLKLSGARQIAELEAHLSGVLHQVDLDNFTLLDLGGQDSKVIMVRNRVMADFITNDKCAASSGRYLENMAAALGISVYELAEHWVEPVDLNATCAVFGESELIGKIAEGHSTQRLAAGVNETIVKRVEPLLLKLRSDVIVFTGGVAKNRAIRAMLEQRLGVPIVIPKYPEYTGAIGAAVSAQN